LPDLPFLDDVQGRLHADVTVEVRLPIIKSRRAVHSVRLPIEDGAIDFKQLESSLARLEDALLDFEVTNDSLILERDLIPGITVDNQTLVSWPLEGRDHALAKQHKRVRLRKLLEYRINPVLLDKADERESAARLRHLDIDNLDLEIGIAGPSQLVLPDFGVLTLGTDQAPALKRLRIFGAIHYSPEQPRDATELNLEVERFHLGAAIPNLHGRRVAVGAFEVNHVDRGQLRFLGFQPVSLSVTAHGIRVSALTVHDAIG
jgi:hypothetical protein